MIRVLHFVSSIGRNGVMNFLMNYYKRLDKSKIRFDFVYYFDTENSFEKEIIENGGKIYKIEKPSFKKSFREQYKRIIKNNSYKIVHCHPIYLFFFIGKISKKNGVKHIIQHSHSSKYSNNFISSVRNKLLMVLFNKRITDFAACSEDALNLFPQKVKKQKKYTILTNAIEINKFIFNEENRKQIRKEFNISNKTKVIGHVGRFTPEKNHSVLLKIFQEYNKKNNDSILFLIGDGDTKESMVDFAKKLKISDKVIFAGVRNDVEKILSAFDFFIFPSIYEGLGIVAIEAQANGLFTICSQGIPDDAIVSNIAIKTDINDTKNIVSLIEKNEIYNRKNMYKEISDSGFNIDLQKEKLEEFYLSLD